jgi:hypothetical protein
MKKQNKLSLLEIIDIFKALIELRDYLGYKDLNDTFTGMAIDSEARKKYNILAKQFDEFYKADFKTRAKLLNIKLK